MTQRVLIIGGQGRIGRSVAQDLVTHTDAEIIATGRKISDSERAKKLHPQIQLMTLELAEVEKLTKAIASSDLVIHCAGPFHYRDANVLKICIEEGVIYLDVSDHRSFYHRAIVYQQQAEKAGVTAILNTGIFPGISNSMVRQGVEQFDDAETIHLSYVVGGSGGAGKTVMRTTFLGLRQPFEVWMNGKWQTVLPYSDREVIHFPKPLGNTGVYWFDMPEAYTFAESFNVKNVITKFGSIPDFYNHLTWIAAHVFPASWLQNPAGIEFLSHVSYKMTSVTDKFSGIGVAMRSQITGYKDGKKAKHTATFIHENTAVSAGMGTGSVAEFILSGKLKKPGIWPIEQALSTPLFEASMKSRNISIHQEWSIEEESD
ncbi:MAG: saccharopine dehydrogenase family protein [Chroococcales cyanobacterium]